MARRFVLPQRARVNVDVDFDNELNPQQLDVATSGEGPKLVIAGAGSGKTRTLTYRVAYLLQQGVPPGGILLVTFTNKAAREMLGRVAQLTRLEPHHLWGGTFHSVFLEVLEFFRFSPEGRGIRKRRIPNHGPGPPTDAELSGGDNSPLIGGRLVDNGRSVVTSSRAANIRQSPIDDEGDMTGRVEAQGRRSGEALRVLAILHRPFAHDL